MMKARKLWSVQEDDVLYREVSKQVASYGEARDWRRPAAALPGRSNKDCRKRWLKLQGSVNKGLWSEEENERLREAVRLHSRHWTEVARVVRTRHADQCAKRWLHFLDPELDYSKWTQREDELLLAGVRTHGRNWRRIVNETLRGRSATDAKNRYTILRRYQRNRTESPFDPPTLPGRRSRPRSTYSQGSDRGGESVQEPETLAWINPYVEDSVESIDAAFNEDAFDSTQGVPNTYEDMLSDSMVKREGCELLSTSTLQQYTAMSWRGHQQTLSLRHEQNNIYLPCQSIEADILHPISPTISDIGSYSDYSVSSWGVADATAPVEIQTADPGSAFVRAASSTYFGSSSEPEFASFEDYSTYVRPADCFVNSSWIQDTIAC